MNPFDAMQVPLRGRRRIEASAGTGKTFTMTSLHLRLVVEAGLPVQSILAVTFTDAATAELRDRIRRRLHSALDAFRIGTPPEDDEVVGGLMERVDPGQARGHLEAALRDFDEAAIHTIHTFCKRVLAEHAFESGRPFDVELLPDSRPITRQVAEDFWRREMLEASPDFLAWSSRSRSSGSRPGSRGMAPEELEHIGRLVGARTDVRILPEDDPPSQETIAGVEEEVRALREVARQTWGHARDEVLAILREDSRLKRTSYKPKKIPEWVDALESWLDGSALFPLPDKLEKFDARTVEAATKAAALKDDDVPEHPFFDQVADLRTRVDELQTLYAARVAGLKALFARTFHGELRRRLEERDARNFDHLLLDLWQALEGPHGGELARALARRYRAGLIDEFQDTDPTQYGIFERIFRHGNTDPPLFLIGDPKQAIYGFRGADVFTYMAAAGDVVETRTLLRNWRSTPALVRALNALFSAPSNPFRFAAIPFHPVGAGHSEAERALLVEGRPDPAPLRIWTFPGQERRTPPTASWTETRILQAVTAEVIDLLERASRGELVLRDGGVERPLEPSDICILCRKNEQATRMQEHLRRRGVPSALQATASLFASREAREMCTILRALIEPRDERRLRGALATEILGRDAAELDRLRNDEQDWDACSQRFGEYRDRWFRDGLMAAFHAVMRGERVRQRLLALVGGERRMTNLLHCLEVLHQAERNNHLGPDGLARWLAQQVNENPDAEEYQLRMETDAKAVQITTIHKSKGLEFPVVFAPFTNPTGGRPTTEPARWHESEQTARLSLDLGTPDLSAHRAAMEEESRAEEVRLLYVALTRAVYRCYTTWIPGKSGDKRPALNRLLFGDEGDENEEVLEHLCAASGGTLRAEPLPAPRLERLALPSESPGTLECRTFGGTLRDDWRISSFSYLAESARGAVASAATPEGGPDAPAAVPLLSEEDTEGGVRPGADESGPPFAGVLPEGLGDDEEDSLSEEPFREDAPRAGDVQDLTGGEDGVPPPAGAAEPTLLDFPRGRVAGLCLHEVFERVDFQDPGPDCVTEALERHGFDTGWSDAVCRGVRDVLNTSVGDGFTLASLLPEDRLHEMEFTFPAARVTAHGLAEAIPRHRNVLRHLDFRAHRGFLRGFIDLVFRHDGRYWLADWKGSWLGPSPADYDATSMTREMDREVYVLQYHLYTVALHRHLTARLPGYDYDRDFGGAYYFFIRGMRPGTPYGVLFDRPERTTVEALESALGGEERP